jgi:pimeloyl-ACP methyl ester carboxylesterase
MFPGVTPELATHYVESQYLTDQSGQLQLRIPVPGEMLTRFLALKESWAPTDYEGIDVPVLAIRAAQAGYFASNLEARGFATDSIDLAVRWAREVDDVQKGGTTEALLQAVPGARSVVLDSTSHTLPLDRPEVVSRLILEFLASEVSR